MSTALVMLVLNIFRAYIPCVKYLHHPFQISDFRKTERIDSVKSVIAETYSWSGLRGLQTQEMPCHGDSEIPGCPPGGGRGRGVAGHHGNRVYIHSHNNAQCSEQNPSVRQPVWCHGDVIPKCRPVLSLILEYCLNIRCKPATAELWFIVVSCDLPSVWRRRKKRAVSLHHKMSDLTIKFHLSFNRCH